MRNFIEQGELNSIIEEQINAFLADPSKHYLQEQARNEGWFGSKMPRDHKGLLGYYRASFGKQIKILNNLDNIIPIYQTQFVDWFRSDFFINETLRNGFISSNLVKKEHFEIIKNNKL
jgi:hypothetical protein